MTDSYLLRLAGDERDWLLNVLQRRSNDSDSPGGALYRRLLRAEGHDARLGEALPAATTLPEPVGPPAASVAAALREAGRRYTLADTRLPTPAGQPTEERARPASRDDILATAGRIISGDRRATYGDARGSFARIAELWGTLLDIEVTATMVARMMIAMKISRLHEHDDHADSWVDIAGYAALGAEIAGVEL